MEAIKRSRSVAIVLPSAANLDAMGSGLALTRFIEAAGKPVELICHSFVAEPHLSFLPELHRIKSSMRAARNFTLSMPITGDLHDLRHEIKDGRLNITITPSEGSFDPSGVSTTTGAWRHDLVIAICVHELSELGLLLSNHRRFFEETPIFNIDTHPENENYGTVNIIDLRASATAELMTALIEAIDAKCLDADTATCLLAGIIGETKSFRSSNVTPRTLETAGRLVARGARREAIVEAIFRTRPVETLRLWGRVLARLKADREHKIVWSILGREDFLRAGADETHLADVIDELISRAPDAEVVCLLHEHPQTPNTVCGWVSAERGWNAMDMAAKWNPIGTPKRARVQATGISLPAFEQGLINDVRATVSSLRRR
jgi:phosphoesterase RecJ-like protein